MAVKDHWTPIKIKNGSIAQYVFHKVHQNLEIVCCISKLSPRWQCHGCIILDGQILYDLPPIFSKTLHRCKYDAIYQVSKFMGTLYHLSGGMSKILFKLGDTN